jgi:multiple sugar transport system substrate-binding protein
MTRPATITTPEFSRFARRNDDNTALEERSAMNTGTPTARLTRRALLMFAGGLAGVGLLSACGSGTGGTAVGATSAGATSAGSTAALTLSTTATSTVGTATAAATTSASAEKTTVASTSSAAGTKAAAATATITRKAGELLITSWNNNQGSIDYFGENVKAFVQQSPGTPATYDPLGADYEDKVLSQAAGGTPPDVLLQGGRDFGLFVSKGLLVDLDPLVARDHYDATDFFTICIQLTTWKNKLYGLPDDLNLLGIYYNKDLFQKAGVPLPPTAWGTPDWSWQAFEETARKLTVSSGGQTTQFGADVGYGTTDLATMLWSNGGAYLNQDWTKCLLDQPQAITAMQYVQDLLLKDKVLPSPADLAKQGSNPRFFGGTVAMRIAGAYFSNPASQSIKSFTWDVAALPTGPAGAFSVTGGSQGASWSIATGSKQQDNAWKLVQWMAGKESQTVLGEHGWIPARKSAGFQVYLASKALPPNKKVFVDATDHVKAIPLIANWSDIDKAVGKQLATLWAGAKSTQDVASAMTQQVNGLLAQLPADERA